MILHSKAISTMILLPSHLKWGIGILASVFSAIISRIYLKTIPMDPQKDSSFHYTNVEKLFRTLMIVTACAMAFAHGSNDVSNAIGPVAIAIDLLQPSQTWLASIAIPQGILLLGACGIAVGLILYGHKVIATIGTGITELTPSRGFCAELATISIVVLASCTGLPISTTHTLVGAILGIGLARGINALNGRKIISIFSSWLITLPAGAGLSILFYMLLNPILP
jgi:inorganic phosphate transporter, PiT family